MQIDLQKLSVRYITITVADHHHLFGVTTYSIDFLSPIATVIFHITSPHSHEVLVRNAFSTD